MHCSCKPRTNVPCTGLHGLELSDVRSHPCLARLPTTMMPDSHAGSDEAIAPEHMPLPRGDTADEDDAAGEAAVEPPLVRVRYSSAADVGRVGLFCADVPHYADDVAAKLRAAKVWNLVGGARPSVEEMLSTVDVVVLWTASWVGKDTRYDKVAAGDLLAEYIDRGGRVVELYTNGRPAGRWTQERYPPLRHCGVTLIKDTLPDAPIEHTTAFPRDAPAQAPRVAAPLWVNTVEEWRGGAGTTTALLAQYPRFARARDGSDAPPLVAVRQHPQGVVVQCNAYPVSRDATRVEGPRSLWEPGQTDLRPLLHWCVSVAYSFGRAGAVGAAPESAAAVVVPYLQKLKAANRSGRWGEDATHDLCREFVNRFILSDGAPSWREQISRAIHIGVPLWNSGDYAGCTACYKAVSTVLGTLRALPQRHPELGALGGAMADELAEAVSASAALPSDGSLRNESQGWLLRNTFDRLRASSDSLPHSMIEFLKAANSSGRWSDDATRDLCRTFVSRFIVADNDPTWREQIRHAIRIGVPLWNSGDYAGCTACYKAVSTVLGTLRALPQRHPELGALGEAMADTLADAVSESDALRADAASRAGSQGWLLRNTFDGLLATSENTSERDASSSDEEEDDYDAGVDYGTLPKRMVCPITHRIMKEPTIVPDGYSYERKAIETWLQKHSTSPMTNLPMAKQLIPNRALGEEIAEILATTTSSPADGAEASPAAPADDAPSPSAGFSLSPTMASKERTSKGNHRRHG
eukprot:TRINITY_DN3099_c0_g2_i1.p1 TRINITY_DN3099_c0_g2~~TRINITY_DN3099_c0_g2_i1.p1  ORF type:complete len:752 (+),score=111.10 TRINITY_DN3099_c0_g2_i1:140-2395(+)